MNLKKIYPLIGILIFILILAKIDIFELFSIFKNINPLFFGFAILIYLFYLLLRILNWKYLLSLKGIHYSFKNTLLVYLSGMFIGLITPGRLGDFTKAYYLKKEGHSFIKSFVTVFIDRLFDVSFLFIIGYFSMFFFTLFFKKQILLLTLLILVAIIGFFLISLNKKLIKVLLKKMFKKFIPEKYKEKIKIGFLDAYSELKSFNKRKLILSFMIISLSWFVYFFQMYLVTIALNINISFTYVIICLAISSLFAMIPISISGIGTRDAVFIFLFLIIGLTKELAISFSLAVLFFMLIASILGLICLFIKPLRLNND